MTSSNNFIFLQQKKLETLLNQVNKDLETKATVSALSEKANVTDLEAISAALNVVSNIELGPLASITVTGTPSNSTYLRGDNTWATLPYPAQTSSQSFPSANVNLTNSGTWYTVTSLTLAAGTWLVMATGTFVRGGSGTRSFAIRIASSSTNYATASQGMAAVSGNTVETSCSAIVTLTSSTTINMQGATNTTSSPVDYATYQEIVVGNSNASGLVAVRVA
jgi:hypothetical protein